MPPIRAGVRAPVCREHCRKRAEYDEAEYEADEARRRPPPHLAPLMLPHTSLRVRRRLRCLRTRARMALSLQLAILKDLDYCLVAP